MSKELESFENIMRIYGETNSLEGTYNNFLTIKKALKRLEAIDNAKPSEALECSLKLYKMVESAGNGNGFNLNEAWKYHNTIKQVLLKAQEQEKVLEIIKKKRANVNQLLLCWKVEMYNSRCRKGYELSKEEFDTLKRWL